MPLTTSDAPNVLDKKIKKVYIKDGQRKILTSNGFMFMPSSIAKKMFGKHKGGRYSQLQDREDK